MIYQARWGPALKQPGRGDPWEDSDDHGQPTMGAPCLDATSPTQGF